MERINMRLVERSLQIPIRWDRNILSDIRDSVSEHLGGDSIPVRFIVSDATQSS